MRAPSVDQKEVVDLGVAAEVGAGEGVCTDGWSTVISGVSSTEMGGAGDVTGVLTGSDCPSGTGGLEGPYKSSVESGSGIMFYCFTHIACVSIIFLQKELR